MKKHKHADLIIAWAYGQKIQVWSEKHNRWEDRPNPVWLDEWKYRVKPNQILDMIFRSASHG